jgi:hypothetical protein
MSFANNNNCHFRNRQCVKTDELSFAQCIATASLAIYNTFFHSNSFLISCVFSGQFQIFLMEFYRKSLNFN